MKGFTLVELLAVIVILAVIALIATPIVLSIINDTKESAVIRSAEMYVGAVENKIMQENMKLGGKLNPKECIVGSDGNVTCDGTYLEIEVNGDKPDSGLITYDRGRVTGITLTFGERKVVTNQNGELVLETTDSIQVCTLISGNPNEIGSKYECEVKSGIKYNFYVLSHESDGTTNLIMERNICEDGSLATEDNPCYVEWINQSDYEGLGGERWGAWWEINISKYGPVTAMNYLNNATKEWNNIQNLNIIHNDVFGNFLEFSITGKARMPHYSEMNEAGCEDYSYLTCPVWITNYLNDSLDDLEVSRQENSIDGIYGYWTLSSSWNVIINVSILDYRGCLEESVPYTNSYYGVRPVINVKI